MASFVLKDARVEINSVVLSTFVRRVRITHEAEAVEDTAMCDNTKTRLPGLKDWSAEVEFNQDYAASAVDATLFSLVGAAAFAVKFRPTSSAISATNPEYQGNAVLPSYEPFGQSVGELATSTITLLGSGDLTRAVA